MCDCLCYVVPPHLLRSISDSHHNTQAVRAAARDALARQTKVNTCRHDRTKAIVKGRSKSKSRSRSRSNVLWGRVRKPSLPGPPNVASVDLLRHIANSETADERVRERARRDLEKGLDAEDRAQAKRKGTAKYVKITETPDESQLPSDGTFYRAIYDAKNSMFEFALPGSMVRAEGEPPTKDKAVNDAYNNVGYVLQMFKDFYNWNSLDNKNMHVLSTVHFGVKYENAYWDPDRIQMVFGDGDEFLTNFTGTVDVIGHELTHAVTENICPLLYYGQSGALNEHISDVFGIIVKQRLEREDAAHADWLVGEGCLVPGIKGIALRSMKAPGTAYDDPRFGKDPQPDNFKDYVKTFEDNGGVHIYSGIPNKAFYLAAKEFGGYSWQRAGKIWWDTLQSGDVDSNCSFVDFANATIKAAKKSFDDEAATVITNAWKEVGVITDKGADDEGSGWMDRVMSSCKPL